MRKPGKQEEEGSFAQTLGHGRHFFQEVAEFLPRRVLPLCTHWTLRGEVAPFGFPHLKRLEECWVAGYTHPCPHCILERE